MKKVTVRKTKKTYRIKNWPAYNESLKQRGSLEMWLDQEMLDAWYALPTGKQGAQPLYSDAAITLSLQFGAVFSQRLRQTEGLVQSLFVTSGIDLRVPSYTTLSRRGDTVTVELRKTRKENVVLIGDSSGLKVYGEGEWKVKKHGASKHRTWRKMHIVITPDGELRAVSLTPNTTSDDQALPNLLTEEKAPIQRFLGDGAYDTRRVYEALRLRKGTHVLIPPREGARIWHHGNLKASPHPRDENLRMIRASSRARWKAKVGYHTRSLAETAIFRFKTIFGDRLHARSLKRQATEVMIRADLLNKMMSMGMPRSFSIA